MESFVSGASRRVAISVSLRVHGVGKDTARALAAAVRPDNRTAPSWMSITERVDGDDLVIEVVAEVEGARRIGSIRNTVDEILEYLYSLLKSIEETTKTLKQPGDTHGGTGAVGNEPQTRRN